MAFDLNGVSVVLDSLDRSVIDVEQGQAVSTNATAVGPVLIAQNGSPVYYDILVNDVFANFRTMQSSVATPTPTPADFPTSAPEATAIANFAQDHGRPLVDSETLAMEVKTSWIEATGIPNPDDYITTTATIPIYDKSSKHPDTWVLKGQKTTTLLMVGMHVVGSVAGHPEMIWATFEHIGNAPNNDYSYVKTDGTIKSVPLDTSGTWLFFPTGASPANANQQRNQLDPGTGNIIAASSMPVGPDTIIRMKAWGAADDRPPNPLVDSAHSNSQIISINNTVHDVLKNGDVRRNYILTGATWMIAFELDPNNFDFTPVGTSQMSNTTMETFFQGQDNLFSSSISCFFCHGGTTAIINRFNGTIIGVEGNDNSTGTSHIFADSILATPTPTPIPKLADDAVVGIVTLPNPPPYQGSTTDYHVKVNVTNTGTSNWTATSGYRLGSTGLRVHASTSSITATVPSGSSATFDVVVSRESLDTVAPGSLTLQMQKGTTWFGGKRMFSVCERRHPD